MKKYSYLIVLIFLLISCNEIEIKDEGKEITKAVAVLQPLNNSSVNGLVLFENQGGIVEVIADINGLERGEHGFHIHTFGDMTDENGNNTGAIFNPENTGNMDSPKGNKFVGNLGNIYALNDTLAEFRQEIYSLSLNGDDSIIGRSVLVHESEDDYESLPCGNAGKILAAGIIGIAKK